MDTKTILFLMTIIFVAGLLIGYVWGTAVILNVVADKALSLGNFSSIVQAKIKDKCLADLNWCFGER